MNLKQKLKKWRAETFPCVLYANYHQKPRISLIKLLL